MATPFVSVSCLSPLGALVLNFLGSPETRRFPLMSQAHLSILLQELSASCISFSCLQSLEKPSHPHSGGDDGGHTFSGPCQEMAHILFITAPSPPPPRVLHVSNSTLGCGLCSSSLVSHAYAHTRFPGQPRNQVPATAIGLSVHTHSPFWDVWFLLSSLPGGEGLSTLQPTSSGWCC